MKEEKERNNKNIIMIVLILLFLVIVGVVAYAAFNYTGSSSTNTIKTGKISMSYAEPSNAMILNNAVPTADNTGKAQTDYFQFTVTSHATTNAADGMEVVIPYEINISSKPIDLDKTQLPENKIKVYLVKVVSSTEEELVAPVLISALSASTLSVGNTKVYNTTDVHKAAGSAITTTYRLRAWIDSSMNISGSTIYQYKFTINVNSQDAFVQMSGGGTASETDLSCFDFTKFPSYYGISNVNGISEYKCYAGNPYSLPTITDVVIPNDDGVKVVDFIFAGSFSGKGITSVVIPGNIEYIEETSFFSNQITSVLFMEGVTFIGEDAFHVNLLTNLKFPDSLKTIDGSSFYGNQLTTVTLGTGITTIEPDAFGKSVTTNPNLTTIINPSGKSFDWSSITGSSTPGQVFVTGTIVHQNGNITVSAS